MTTTHPPAFTASDLKSWVVDRLRRTNWIAAGVAAALQGGVLAMLIMMGIVQVQEPKPEKRVVTVLATQEQQPAAAPAPPQPQEVSKHVVQPKAEVAMPPVKVQLSTSPPVAAAPQQAPEPAPPAPAPAAPAAPPAAPAPSAGSGPVSVSNLTTNLLSGTPPSYPVESRHKHEEGTVVLWLVISREGRVSQASIQQSSGYPKLDEAALAAVRKWRWSPTVRDGRPVEIAGAVRIPFKLRKS